VSFLLIRVCSSNTTVCKIFCWELTWQFRSSCFSEIMVNLEVCLHFSSYDADFVTVCVVQEIYEPPMPPSPLFQQKQAAPQVLSIPPHSLVTFGLFLRLPGYAEVLLKEKCKAQCLLRLIFGVTDDGEGGC